MSQPRGDVFFPHMHPVVKTCQSSGDQNKNFPNIKKLPAPTCQIFVGADRKRSNHFPIFILINEKGSTDDVSFPTWRT